MKSGGRRFAYDRARYAPGRANGPFVITPRRSKALAIYRSPTGLVLIDVVMPVMDGYDGPRDAADPADEWSHYFLSSKEADQDWTAPSSRGDDYLSSRELRCAEREDPRLQRIESTRVKLLEPRESCRSNASWRTCRADGYRIANRRYFDSYLLTEMKRASRERQRWR